MKPQDDRTGQKPCILWLLGLLFLAMTSAAFAQQPHFRFEHIKGTEEFSNVRTMSIAQDAQGFMWFASLGAGLARYDGYDFRVFQHNELDPYSIANNEVHHLNVDTQGVLWAATASGLSVFDTASEKFTTYRENPDDADSLRSSFTTFSLVDHRGTLWVGTDNGLARQDSGSTKFHHYALTPEKPGGMAPTYVECLYLDNDDTLWVGTLGGGLLRHNRDTDEFTRYRHDPEDPNSLGNDHIRSIVRTNDGILWVATDDGLSYMHESADMFSTYRPDENDPTSLKGRQLGTLFEDRFDNLWIAGHELGLYLFDRKTTAFHFVHHDPADPASIGSGSVWSLYQDRSGVLWVGTETINRLVPSNHAFRTFANTTPNARETSRVSYKMTGAGSGILWLDGLEGVDRLDTGSNTWQRFSLRPDNPADGHNDVSAMHRDRSGNLWVANPRHLNRVNQLTGEYTSVSIEHKPNCIYVDTKDRLWMCMPFYGFVQFDFKTGEEIIRYETNDESENSLSHSFTYFATQDSTGRFWIGSYSGLNLFDPESGQFTHFKKIPGDPQSISHDSVRVAIEDTNGNVWFGTSNGLNRFNPSDNSFVRHYNGRSARKNNISDIVLGTDGRFWVAHAAGISEFDPETGFTRDIDAAMGMPLVYGSSIVWDDEAQLLYATTPSGVIQIDTDKIFGELDDNPVALTAFRLFNRPVPINSEATPSPLGQAISVTESLTMQPGESMFSLEFAALGALNPGKTQYEYRMDGFNDDWIATDSNRRVATYTNMPPGQYEFQVKTLGAATATVLPLNVLPPWWRTYWAYFIFVVAFSLLTFGFIQLRTHAVRQRRDELETVVNERTHELAERKKTIESQAAHLEELISIKDRYIANISHEFRTPLTVILSPIDRLLSRSADGQVRQYLKAARRNGSRLLRLVDKLLGLARIESDQIGEKFAQPIRPVINLAIASLESMAHNKNVQILASNIDDAWAFCSTDVLEEVMVNLLSNAIKFTSDGDTITVRADCPEDSFIRLIVHDSGSGIPEDQLDNVFDRFYRVDERAEMAPGAGLGLALVKELVIANDGSVDIQSEFGVGTRVEVRLPAASRELITAAGNTRPNTAIFAVELDALSTSQVEAPSHSPELQERPQILVVEDNLDLCHHIAGALGDDVQCMFAHDGETGIEKAIAESPDLIICDVMLPNINGFEVTRHLKQDERTSHIPIIILTARVDQESRLQGLRELADDYIAKPFNEPELRQRVETILSIREILRQRFSRHLYLGDAAGSPPDLSERDRKFMSRVDRALQENFEDSEFTTIDFADSVAMSERQLQRKLKSITNVTPREYLRHYRLNKAMEKLLGGGSATDAAFAVGFQSHSYFAKCFKAHFNIAPSKVFHSRKSSG